MLKISKINKSELPYGFNLPFSFSTNQYYDIQLNQNGDSISFNLEVKFLMDTIKKYDDEIIFQEWVLELN
ncbi:MAG: hypothetical protein K0Q49_1004 [Haloplasmataceae bacterium]|jgi:hypothetical protein|nr:hypothetical protein [Haloplasmataceae bacterium]